MAISFRINVSRDRIAGDARGNGILKFDQLPKFKHQYSYLVTGSQETKEIIYQ